MPCQTSPKSPLILVTPETLILLLSLDKPVSHTLGRKVEEEKSVLTLPLHFEPIKSQDLSHFYLDFFYSQR